MASRYQLLDRIGKGGMAELYRARVLGEEGFSKIVALKRILPQHASNERFVKMLIDEARLAAQLSHPNIVQVFELGRDARGLFIAMEFVAGPNLHALLVRLAQAGASLPEPQALDIAIQLLQALEYAHHLSDAMGTPLQLVHRDVSPENLLVTAEGAVKLLDFGVAKAKNRLQETQAGGIKGKLPYMSPEQVTGKAVDGRTDLFAAGLVLWECLTGRLYYDAQTDYELMRQVYKAEWRGLDSVGLKVAPEIERALKKALSPKAEDRYQSAGEFANDLMLFHRQAFPGYSPKDLGRLVAEHFGSELAQLADRLRRFQSGEEKPAEVIEALQQADIGTKPVGSAAASMARLGEAIAEDESRRETAIRPRKPSGIRPRAKVTGSQRAVETKAAASDDQPLGDGIKETSARARRRNTGQSPAPDASPETASEPPSRGTSPVALILGFLLAGGAVGGGFYLFERAQPPPAPPPNLEVMPLDRPAAATAPAAQPDPPAAPAKAPPNPPRPGASAAVGKKPGFLDVDCEPECEVEVDGRRYGVSPVRDIELAPGRHKLRAFNRFVNLNLTAPVDIASEKRIGRALNLVTGKIVER